MVKKTCKDLVNQLNMDVRRIKQKNISDEKKVNLIHKMIEKKMRKIYICIK